MSFDSAIPSDRTSGAPYPEAVDNEGISKDIVLARRVRAGDTAAFEELYAMLFPSLWRFAYSYTHSRVLAQELVQDVFVAVWELGPRWNIGRSVQSYFFRAIRNRALNVAKHHQRMARFEERVSHDDDIPALGKTSPDAQDQILAGEQRTMLSQAVAQLAPRAQRAILLRIEEQLSYEEIGEILEISSAAARMLINRAQQTLRELLAPYLAS